MKQRPFEEVILPKSRRITVQNGSGSALSAGTAVCVTGYNGRRPIVSSFFAGGTVVGVLAEPLDAGDFGVAVQYGVAVIGGTFTEGQVLFATESGIDSGLDDGSDVLGYSMGDGKMFVEITGTSYTDGMATDAIGAIVDGTLVYGGDTLGVELRSENEWLSPQSVPDDAYDADSWNDNTEVPTKNAIRDRLESGLVGSEMAYVEVTENYDITSDDYFINCTSGTFTVNLPTAVGVTGRMFIIKNTGGGTITVDGDGSETIDGSLTQLLTTTDSLHICSTGVNWIIL